MIETPAITALQGSGLHYEVVTTERATSVDESAAFQGIEVGNLLKTLVVRRGEDDYLLILVPGPRSIDWTKLRAHLGIKRMTLPDAEEAQDVTGYPRGAITPFGTKQPLPVVADASIPGKGTVAIGGGAHGVNLHIDADELIAHIGAEVADVTKTG
jgi:Cys-tRNA(Pro)/Cys-tRNA(Cys) deacylase